MSIMALAFICIALILAAPLAAYFEKKVDKRFHILTISIIITAAICIMIVGIVPIISTKFNGEIARYEVTSDKYGRVVYVKGNRTEVAQLQPVYDTETNVPYVSLDRFQLGSLGIFYYNQYRLHVPGKSIGVVDENQ